MFANDVTNKGLVCLTASKPPNQQMGRRPNTFLQSRYTDGQEARKRCSISLLLEKRKSNYDIKKKRTTTYHITPARMSYYQKSIKKRWREAVEKREPLLHCWQCKLVQPLGSKQYGGSFKKILEDRATMPLHATPGHTPREKQDPKGYMHQCTTAALLFTTAETWKQPKCPSTGNG